MCVSIGVLITTQVLVLYYVECVYVLAVSSVPTHIPPPTQQHNHILSSGAVSESWILAVVIKLTIIIVFNDYRSKSTNDLSSRDDQDERNERYEQLQTLKELLKEEEDSWTSVSFLTGLIFNYIQMRILDLKDYF